VIAIKIVIPRNEESQTLTAKSIEHVPVDQ